MAVSEKAGYAPLALARGEGRTVHVMGEEITIKIASVETGGAFTVIEGRTRPLHGPPLHRHQDQDEWWYVVEGEYRFEVDGEEIFAGPGATVFAPRGSRHTFQNIGTSAGHTIATFVPGGVDLFFEELEAAVPRGAVPDPVRLLPICQKHHQELLGPPLAAKSAQVAAGAD
jgi:mannose-6-phosphate isomerase-like protein (cupin superfamily)